MGSQEADNISALGTIITNIQTGNKSSQLGPDISTLLGQLMASHDQAGADAQTALSEAQQAQIDFLRAYMQGNNLYNAQTQLLSISMPQRLQSDVQTTARQFEINEYYYSQKLDILFILQLCYIGLLLVALFAVGYSVAAISGRVLAAFATVIFLIIAATAAYQLYYNYETRGRVFWDNRRFDPPPAAAHQGGHDKKQSCSS